MSFAHTLIPHVRRALTDEWQTTQQIARAIGHSWKPGSSGLRPVRDVLYALLVADFAEQQVRKNGHLWRRADAA